MERIYKQVQWKNEIPLTSDLLTCDKYFMIFKHLYDFLLLIPLPKSLPQLSFLLQNQLKSYEFLGELEEHFIAEKVQYLYEFVHSILSLIFTMIREGPSQRSQKPDDVKKLKTIDVGIQTEESHNEDQKKTPVQNSTFINTRHKKRVGLQIQIFEKDLTEMSFRERRRALQKMRDMIYAQDDQVNEPNSVLKDLKPNVDKISYSKSDESIKAAIDTFKQSDISTHIFLKHFMQEFVEIKDIKSSSQLLNKELIQSMSRAITKYKEVKYHGKGRFRLISHTIEDIIYPTVDDETYKINVSSIAQNERVKLGEKDNLELRQSITLLNDISNLIMPRNKQNDLKLRSQIQRSKFPSLMMRQGEELNSILQTKSQESIGSSKSSIESKGKQNIKRKKLKSSFSQDEFSSSLGRSSEKKNRPSSQIPLLLQKNNVQAFRKPRQSFRLSNSGSQMIQRQKQKLKESNGVKSKKLRKRNISNFMDRKQDRASFRNEKGK